MAAWGPCFPPKGVAEKRLRAAEDELTKLRVKTKSDSRALRGLEADRASLTTRLKDREHELREKRKLVEVKTAHNVLIHVHCVLIIPRMCKMK